MTVLKNMGAVSTPPDWKSINWTKVQEEVMKLQVRIAKATKQGRWNKVKALQWLLTHSFSAKCLAVKRVTTNRGKRTPGVDGVVLKKDEEKHNMVRSMSRRDYQPQPLRRIYIPKSGGGNKKRPLGIPTMLDRAQQALYTLALAPVAETMADQNSYGFRPQRSAADAIQRIHATTSRKYDPQWVLEGDIKGCFDNIDHDWLLRNVVMDRVILHKWLKAGFLEKTTLFPTEKGTPQGGIISPCLANIVLDGMEAVLDKEFGSRRNLSGRRNRQMRRVTKLNGVRMCRYADDFVISGSSKELLETEVKPVIEAFLKERGLELSAEKTRITHTTEGYDFLGQNVRRYILRSGGSILLTKPSKKNVRAFLTAVRITIRKMATSKQEDLIRTLNPMIRGWGNYHRHIVSKDVYNKVDHEIWTALWRWAKRRHQNKGLRWINQRYFRTIKGVRWVFSCQVRDEGGNKQLLTLAKTSAIRIIRHVHIKLAANPFDPAWDAYFEKRQSVKMRHSYEGRGTLISLWRRQRGLCPQCGKILPVSGQTGIIHYIKGRLKGGEPILSNLILLHTDCHAEGHENGFVVKLPVGAPEMPPL